MDRFIENKKTFLEEMYTSDITKEIMFNVYNRSIYFLEVSKQKDLHDFTTEEIIGMIKTTATSSSNSKANLITFINVYMEWCMVKGIISINPVDAINRDELCMINKKSIAKRMLTKEQVSDLAQELLRYATVIDVLPLILARYGVTGKELCDMTNLRWEDIDHEKKVVNLVAENGEVNEIKVDDLFLYWIDRAKSTTTGTQEARGKDKVITYTDNGFVLKTPIDDIKIKLDMSDVYNAIKRAFDHAQTIRVTFNDLRKAKIFEELLEIRSERRITTSDINNVIKIYKPNASVGAYTPIKRDFDSVARQFDDKVYPATSKADILVDNNSQEISANIYKYMFKES